MTDTFSRVMHKNYLLSVQVSKEIAFLCVLNNNFYSQKQITLYLFDRSKAQVDPNFYIIKVQCSLFINVLMYYENIEGNSLSSPLTNAYRNYTHIQQRRAIQLFSHFTAKEKKVLLFYLAYRVSY